MHVTNFLGTSVQITPGNLSEKKRCRVVLDKARESFKHVNEHGLTKSKIALLSFVYFHPLRPLHSPCPLPSPRKVQWTMCQEAYPTHTAAALGRDVGLWFPGPSIQNIYKRYNAAWLQGVSDCSSCWNYDGVYENGCSNSSVQVSIMNSGWYNSIN